MHICKVQSSKPTNITKQEYQEIYQKIQSEQFFQSLKQIYQQYPFHPISELHIIEPQYQCKMKRNIFRLLEIKGTIQNHKVSFLIDTGAQISAIRDTFYQKLGIKTYKSIDVGSFGGGNSSLESVVVSHLQVGGIEIINHPMLVLSKDTFSMKLMGVDLLQFDAILGWDVLSRIDFELDDISHTFKLIDNSYRFKYPNAIKGGFPFMIGRRKNEVIKIGIDTGAFYSWISKDYMKEHQLKGHSVETISYGVHGKEINQTQLLADFDVLLDRGYIKLKDIMQGPCHIYPSFHYDMILGNEIFKGRRIRFLNSASMVLFT